MRASALIVVAVLAGLPVRAAPRPQSDDLAGLQSEYRDETARGRRLHADAVRAATDLADVERRLTVLRAQSVQDDVHVAAQGARLSELQARERRLAADMSRQQGAATRLLSALQMMSRRPPPPLLVPAREAIDTARASVMLKAMTPELRRRATDLAARQAELARIRRLALLSSEALLTAESDRGDRVGDIEALAERRRILTGVLQADAARSDRAVRQLETRIRALGGRPSAGADPDDAAEADVLPGGRSRLTPPVTGAPEAGGPRAGAGVRWRVRDAEVRAPAAGTVAYAGPLSGWGQVVILDIGPGWRAVVAGLDTVQEQEGSRMGDGAVLGRVSGEGEIYFELRRGDQAVDPSPYLP